MAGMSLPPGPINSRPLTPGRLAVWRALAALSPTESATAGEVAAAAGVSLNTAARSLATLVGDGHVGYLDAAQGDGPQAAYFLTPAGREAAAAVLETVRRTDA